MFHKLSVEVPAEKRAYEAKIASQEEELRSLRAIAAAAGALFHSPDSNPSTGEGKRKQLKTNIPDSAAKKSQGLGAGTSSGGGSHNLSALMRPTTSSAMHAKPKIQLSKVPKAISATKVLSDRRANGISSEDGDHRREAKAEKKSRESFEEELEEDEGEEDEDVVSQYDTSSEDELDETFFPEEEEGELSDVSEDEDLMIEPIRGRRVQEPSSSSSSVTSSSSERGEGDKEKKVAKGKKRSSKELSSDDSSCNSSQKRSKVSTAATPPSENISAGPLEFPTFPLSKYKVPELKKFLSDRSLPMSGALSLPSLPPSLASLLTIP